MESLCLKRSDYMLKLEFTNEEIETFKKKIRFTERQQRIIEYRLDRIEIVKMARLEHCDVSTISREIKEIERKIMKVI